METISKYGTTATLFRFPLGAFSTFAPRFNLICFNKPPATTPLGVPDNPLTEGGTLERQSSPVLDGSRVFSGHREFELFECPEEILLPSSTGEH